MRWYLVPLKLAKIYSASSPLCFLNCTHVGSMMHVWRDCPKIRGFRNKKLNLLRKVTGLPIQKSSHLALLNFSVPETPKLVRRLIMFILIGTKLNIARAWKQPYGSFILVKRKISWIMAQGKTVSTLLDTTNKFEAIWEPWAQYMQIKLTSWYRQCASRWGETHSVTTFPYPFSFSHFLSSNSSSTLLLNLYFSFPDLGVLLWEHKCFYWTTAV